VKRALGFACNGEQAASPERPPDVYRQPGPRTDPLEFGNRLDALPTDLPGLCAAIQGLLVHVLEARRYGVEVQEARRPEVEIGDVATLLRRIVALDGRPLTLARPPPLRVVATCHGFSLLLCAALRRQGRAARPRPGFAAYLVPGKYIDHWTCEVWDSDAGRWAIVDAQLDQVQRDGYAIAFDPCDVPEDQFVLAGRAWTLARAGVADPNRFGFARWWGLGYLRHQVLRDLFALNREELLPWHSSGLPEQEEQNVTEVQRAAVDRIAELTMAADAQLGRLRAALDELQGTGSPPDWAPWTPEQVQKMPRSGWNA